MKKIAVLSLSSLLAMGFTSMVWACHFETFTPGANCEGWSVTGSIFLPADYADLTYTVTLSDAGGIIATFTGSERIFYGAATFAYGSSWGMELCGDYTAAGSFSFVANTGETDSESFSIAFTCICDEPDGCTGTPGYWFGSGRDWPVSSLTLGAMSYSKTVLEGFWEIKPKGDKSVKLIHHLIAAKLNILSGAPTSIQPTIDAADAWLVLHGLFSNPTGAAASEALALKNALVAYNESDPCGTMPAVPIGPSFTTIPQQDESRSWGAIKEIYSK